MTTVELASARPVATRLHMTARGRRVAAALIALPVAAALAWGMLGESAALASRDAGAPEGSFETVTVMAGESLWTVAQSIAPSADPRDVVDALVRLNALDGAAVRAGQRLAVPAAYASEG